jgi:hypothetical protein
MLQEIPVYFQWVSLTSGSSVRHGCDMKENKSPVDASGSSVRPFAVMDTEDAPVWVPPAVRSMAKVMPVGADIAHRLLTDGRMKTVWRELKRTPVASEEIPSVLSGPAFPPRLQVANLNSFERLKTWDIPDQGISLQEQACAAFFAYAVIELSSQRAIGTQAQFDVLAKKWLDAANLCRSIGEKTAAERIEDQVRLRPLRSPYILGRSSKGRGDDKTRTQVRALAAAAHRIFGSFLYGTVATIATVALQTKITKQSVINWSDL